MQRRLLFYLGIAFLLLAANTTFGQLTINVTTQDVTCFNGNDGQINLTINAVAPLATTPWDIELQYRFPDNTFVQLAFYDDVTTTNLTFTPGNLSLNVPGADAFGIPANLIADGTFYRIRVTASGSGTLVQRNKSVDVTIDQPTQINPVVNTVTPACTPGTGAITLDVSGGTPFAGPPNYIYTWTGPTPIANTIEDPTNIDAGTYNVTVEDALGCTVDVLNIVVPGPPDATITPAGPFCESDGATNLVAATGGGTWSGTGITNASAGTFDPAIAGPGSHLITYSVTVNTCNDMDTETIVVEALPTITLGANPSICAGVTSTSLSYSATTGTPDQYRIDWDGIANGAGLADVALSALPATPIPINGVPLAAAVYNGMLFVTNSTTTCESIAIPISVTVVDLPTITLGANPSVCAGVTNTTLSYSATTGTPDQYRIDWDGIANGAGLADVALSALPATPIPINGVPLAAGVYNGVLYVTNSGTTCESAGNAISVTVVDLPTITPGANPSVCAGVTNTTLSYSATTGTPDQYRIDWDGIANGAGLADVALSALPVSPISINNVPLTAGVYNGILFVTNSGTTCESAGDPISVTVVDLPTITLGANPSVCAGVTNTTLSYSATTGTPDQYRIDWDGIANGAGLADVALSALPATPIPINGVPLAAGVYNGVLYVTNSGTTCESAGNAISVTVVDLPTITLGANPSVCAGVTNTTLSYSATTGTPDQYRIDWDGIANGAGLADVALSALPATPIPINGVPLAAGVYNGVLYVTNSGSTCESAGNAISVTVVNLPTITLGTNPSVCIGVTSTTLTYSATTGTPDQYRIDWDGVAEGAGLVDVALAALPASPISINNVPVTAGVYNGILYVSTSGTSCESAGDPITVTVVDLPTITLGPNPTICLGVTTANLSYSATTNSPNQYRIDWDAAAETAGLTDVVATALPGTPIVINGIPNAVGTFNGTLYVINSGISCESAGSAFSIDVVDLPTITLGPNPTVCSGVTSSSISYSATTGTPDQYRIDWDATANGAGLSDVALGALPATPIPINNIPVAGGTYTGDLYVSNSGTGCESLANTISVTVQAVTATLSGDATTCGGSATMLTVSFTGPGPTWNFTYSDGFANTSLLANANPFSFSVNPVISTTYSLVSVTGATCGAGTVSGSATITVNPIAGNPSTFGSETWRAYVYDDSGSPAPPATNIDFNSTKYRGFFTETELAAFSAFSSYNTTTDAFDLNFSNVVPVAGPNICGSYLNDYSIRLRMTKTFAAGIYTFSLGADDGVRLLVDGVSVLPAGSFNTHSFTNYTSAPQCLAAGTHNLVIEYFDRGGFSRVNFNYTAAPAPTVTSPVTVCINSPAPTLTASSAGAIDYKWYTDATLTNPPIATGANYTPAAPELDMTLAGTTDFFVTAVYACGETPAAQVTVDVLNGATINLPAPPVQICESSAPVDLTTLVSATPGGGTFTFSGTNVTDPNFDPTGLGGTTVTINVSYTSGTCMASTTFDIDVVNNATATVPVAAVTACESSAIVDLTTLVSATPTGGTFTFAGTGVTGSDFDPTGLSGAQTITVDYNVGGCLAPQQTFDINVIPNVSINTTNTTVCPNTGSVDLLTLVTPSPAGGVFTFTGVGVAGNQFDPSGSAGSTATINVSYDLGGCMAATTLQVTVRLANDPLCGGGPLGNCSTVAITPVPSPAVCSPTDGSILFNINPATPIINNTGVRIDIVGTSTTNQGTSRTNFNDPLFAGLPVGTYDYTIEYGDPGCIKTGQVTVLIGPDVVDFTTSSNGANCFGSSGGVVLSNINGSSVSDYTYEVTQLGVVVSTGTITQLQSLGDVTLTGFANGNYEIKLSQDQSATTSCTNPVQSALKSFTVTVPTANLDTLYVNKKISVPDLPTGSMLVGINESLQEPYEVRLELTQPLFPGQVFAQDFTEATRNPLNLKVEFDAPNLYAGDYLLSLRDAIGCRKDYLVTIGLDTNLAIPNIFTPNGDGVNEVFYIRNLPDEASLMITNRWGKEVFSSSNYQNDWAGGDIADGVYFYRISAGGQSYTGWVEILRGK